jgi:hypothetical protein
VKFFDGYGNVMMEIASVERKGDDLVIRGKMMGSMPGVFYLRPAEVWSASRLLSWPVISYVPRMLYRGWRTSRSTKRAARRRSGAA